MPLMLSPPLVPANATVALQALGTGARAAIIPIVLGAARQSVEIALDTLPPNQQLGPLGSVFIDNTSNSQPVVVTFPDTGMSNDIPANSATYILAITGSQRFFVSSPVTILTALTVLVLNVEVQPTGVQPIAGTIIITAGSVTVTNPGPVNGAVASHSQAVPAATPTVMVAPNPARKYLFFGMPITSDGWATFNGVVPAPNGLDSFYFPPGATFFSIAFVPEGEISVYVTSGGMVPCIEG